MTESKDKTTQTSDDDWMILDGLYACKNDDGEDGPYRNGKGGEAGYRDGQEILEERIYYGEWEILGKPVKQENADATTEKKAKGMNSRWARLLQHPNWTLNGEGLRVHYLAQQSRAMSYREIAFCSTDQREPDSFLRVGRSYFLYHGPQHRCYLLGVVDMEEYVIDLLLKHADEPRDGVHLAKNRSYLVSDLKDFDDFRTDYV